LRRPGGRLLLLTAKWTDIDKALQGMLGKEFEVFLQQEWCQERMCHPVKVNIGGTMAALYCLRRTSN
jgi:hypothetical protein